MCAFLPTQYSIKNKTSRQGVSSQGFPEWGRLKLFLCTFSSRTHHCALLLHSFYHVTTVLLWLAKKSPGNNPLIPLARSFSHKTHAYNSGKKVARDTQGCAFLLLVTIWQHLVVKAEKLVSEEPVFSVNPAFLSKKDAFCFPILLAVSTPFQDLFLLYFLTLSLSVSHSLYCGCQMCARTLWYHAILQRTYGSSLFHSVIRPSVYLCQPFAPVYLEN